MPISQLELRNSTFVTELGAELHYAQDILFDNVTIQQRRGERLTLTDDVRGFRETNTK
jgi:hypothetical protein